MVCLWTKFCVNNKMMAIAKGQSWRLAGFSTLKLQLTSTVNSLSSSTSLYCRLEIFIVSTNHKLIEMNYSLGHTNVCDKGCPP